MVPRYLADFPVDPNDIVHVEDGAWVNADGALSLNPVLAPVPCR